MDGGVWDVHEQYFAMYVNEDTGEQGLTEILKENEVTDG